jgi:hypothetical protein
MDTQPDPNHQDRQNSKLSGWGISLLVHSIVLLIFSIAVYAVTNTQEYDYPPYVITLPNKPEDKKEIKKEQTLSDPTDVKVVLTTDDEVIPNPSPIEIETVEDSDVVDGTQGNEDSLSTSNMGDTGAFTATGVGSGAAGQWGNRKDKRGKMKKGASPATELAVDKSLKWFKRHQNINGQWDASDYWKNCTDGVQCEPASTVWEKECNTDVGVTGYALLCFLGAGQDHMNGIYKNVVGKGLDWLLSQQRKDGIFGIESRPHENYEHAVALMAIAEAYGMTRDERLKAPMDRAVDALLERQNKGTGQYNNRLGWDYSISSSRNDSSLTGWCLMALKSAKMAGNTKADVGLAGGKAWLEATWKVTNPNHKSTSYEFGESQFPYVWYSDSNKIESHGSPKETPHNRSSIGALCAVYLGRGEKDVMSESLLNFELKNNYPTSYPCNLYYLYYNTYTIFQLKSADKTDKVWTEWVNNVLKNVVVKSQQQDGCLEGSWNPPHGKYIGADVGRCLSTAYACLSLQVFYRYDLIKKHK